MERAALAIGRLDARIPAGLAHNQWLMRSAWTGFATALQGDGAEIDEIDVFSEAMTVDIPGRSRIASNLFAPSALEKWQQDLASDEDRHWREIAPYPRHLPDDWQNRPRLLRALQLTAQHAREAGGFAAGLALPHLLRALKITDHCLPCLAFADKAWRLQPRAGEASLARYFRHLAKAATLDLERLQRIEADRDRAAEMLAGAKRANSLRALTALSWRCPAFGPRTVARSLSLSLSGAGKLLSRAGDLGLLVEISGRQAWKTYLAPDLALRYGFVSPPRGRPRNLVTAVRPLDPMLAAFDREMEEIDARLAALGVGTGK